MKYMTSNEIRETWLRFWRSKGHHELESASLVPVNDNTLLWINSGVAAIKKYFDGSEVPKNKRLTNSQKCIRTNDIENVGMTARHHTFFEMLGNFSIGDYFRAEVLPWAMELLTSEEYFGFPIEKLYFTVYPDDKDTYELWQSLGVPKDHLIFTEENNFWEIGEGPCGPCTEIFFDRGAKYHPGGPELIRDDIENDRYIEIWNIVFSQFNSEAGKARSEYKELPFKNIDTGSGLERLCCVLQEADTNYETDLFMPVFKKLTDITKIEYNGQMEFKVIADHIRTVVFAVSDGATLSNEGRGYVLRRLLRRAVKMGRKLGIRHAFMAGLVDIVVENMGGHYSYLAKNIDVVKKVINIEEEKFLKTIEKGEDKIKGFLETSDFISGDEAFLLYDTFGFPIELTKEYAEEAGKTVDMEQFYANLEAQRVRARSARVEMESMNSQNEEYIMFKEDSLFVYNVLELEAKVIKVFEEGIVLDRTCFYAESGGQVADKGTINGVEVKDVRKMPNKQHLHLGQFNVAEGDVVKLVVDADVRQKTMSNHSSIHIMYKVLRDLIGGHVSQQGSFVNDRIFRFDFNNFEALTEQQILNVERLVNSYIQRELEVEVKEMTIDEAEKMGATADFGEKYDDLVRVVNIGGEVVDLCGGTHVSNTRELESFAILQVYSIGSGTFRIEGTTKNIMAELHRVTANVETDIEKVKEKAIKLIEDALDDDITLNVNFRSATKQVESYEYVLEKRAEFKTVQDTVKELDKQYAELKAKKAVKDLDKYQQFIANDKLVIKTTDIDSSNIKDVIDELFNRFNLETAFIANVADDKIVFVAKSRNKSIHCGNLVKEAAVICGGNGGGRPDFAQAGGKDASKVDEAINKIKEII